MSVYPPARAADVGHPALDEEAARAVLVVKAVEEADDDAELLPPADRRWATREAGPPDAAASAVHGLSTPETEFLVRRARLLAAVLERRFPGFGGMLAAGRWRTGVAYGLAAASFVVGLASTELGAARQVNILAFPLLGMLAWNVAVYVVLLARALRNRAGGRAVAAQPAPWRGLAARALFRARVPQGAPPHPALARSAARFLAQWHRCAAQLHAARVRRLLHLCAALLAAGAVAGLYLRGIAFEYRAGWESTFLDARAVHGLLALVLGPASALTGIALPDETALAGLRWGSGGYGENAARWIHLYAATALLFIVLPRMALALAARLEERRRRRDFPLPEDVEAYCRRLLAERHRHERTTSAEVVSVHVTTSPAALEKLQGALGLRLGAHVVAKPAGAVAYGEEEDHLRRRGDSKPEADTVVLVFSSSATPEEENHGLLLHGYRNLASAQQRLIAVLDESSYRRRLGGQAGAETRLAERRAAWQRLAQAHGIELVPLDLASATEDAA